MPVRDRVAVVVALGGAAGVSWWSMVEMAGQMEGMGGGMGAAAEAVRVRAWGVGDFVAMFVMWAVMMVGMMLPSAMPVTLVYAAVARRAGREGTPVGPVGAFVLGYVGAWTFFSVGATLAQWGLDEAALLSQMMVSVSPYLGAGLLVVAGVFQLTPAKRACLSHCRSPAHFLARRFRPGIRGALRVGAEHGLYCLGCCWALMGLLFVGGVMDLVWIAGITLFVLGEKVLPYGLAVGRVSGVGMVLLGVGLLLGWWGVV